jgi:hypothetical protein
MFRTAVLSYVKRMHDQFLKEKEIDWPLSFNDWHPDFDFNEVIIPLGRLPNHPLGESVSISSINNSQVCSVDSKLLKVNIDTKKRVTASDFLANKIGFEQLQSIVR